MAQITSMQNKIGTYLIKTNEVYQNEMQNKSNKKKTMNDDNLQNQTYLHHT